MLYLGQQHVIGNISGSMHKATFDEMYERTSKAFRAANLGDVIGTLQEYFGPDKFSLSSLFSDEKIQIIQAITETSLDAGESTFRNVFNENYQLMSALEEANMPMLASWRNIATYVLNADLVNFFEEEDMGELRVLERISEDMKRWNVKINDLDLLNHLSGQRVFHEIDRINMDESSVARVNWIAEVLKKVKEMGLRPDIWRSQNMFYLITKGYRKDQWVFLNNEWETAFSSLATMLKVRLK